MGDSRTQSVAEISPEELARSNLYHLLGTVLAGSPDQALLDRLHSLEGAQSTDETPLTSIWGELGTAAGIAQPQGLESEYFKLFIGLGRGELVPYASWYVQGALMERILANLRQDLARLGFERSEGVAEPEDHAGALCQTMGMIIAEPGLSLEQSAFYAAYIGPWMGRFFDDLANAETAEFYKVVGRLGGHFIDLERQYFEIEA